MKLTEHRFISFDETPIFYRRCHVDGQRKAILLLAHGIGEHGGRYRDFAAYLAAQGIETVIPDLRGFGKSGGKRGCVRDFSDYDRDLRAVHSHLLSENNKDPLFLLGHSFGGLVAVSYLSHRDNPEPRGLILSSPAFGIAIPIPFWRNALGILFSYFFPDFTQSNQVNPEFLTHDAAEVMKFKTDPLVHHRISARLYSQTKKLLGQRFELAEKITLPTLVLQAGDDRVVLRSETTRFFEALASTDKAIEIYSDFYHEILQETGRQRVYSKISEWISKHI